MKMPCYLMAPQKLPLPACLMSYPVLVTTGRCTRKEKARSTDDMTEAQSVNDDPLQHLAKFWAPGLHSMIVS